LKLYNILFLLSLKQLVYLKISANNSNKNLRRIERNLYFD